MARSRKQTKEYPVGMNSSPEKSLKVCVINNFRPSRSRLKGHSGSNLSLNGRQDREPSQQSYDILTLGGYLHPSAKNRLYRPLLRVPLVSVVRRCPSVGHILSTGRRQSRGTILCLRQIVDKLRSRHINPDETI